VISNQHYEQVPIDQLIPHPDNPRRGDVDAIGESIDAHGFYGAVVAQRSTGRILAGNHRWMALKARGAAEIPVLWVDVNDDQARKILLADNRSTDLATYDESALLALLEQVGADAEALTGTAFSVDDLEDLAARLGEVPTSPPTTVQPQYAESDEETAARAERLGANAEQDEEASASGLREFVVVLDLDEHTEAVARLAELRRGLGTEVSSGDLVLGALRAVTPKMIRGHLPEREAAA
jgi:ParB-like chromosome segregation protein Spo0J